MKRKFLEDLGLESDVIQKIIDENGKDINTLKAQIDNLNSELSAKDITIQEKSSKIAELEKVDVEAIKKEQFELGKAEGSKEIEVFKKQNALDKALQGYKAKDISILNKMLDMEKVKFNDNYEIIEGLEEQINPLKESHDYLFENDNPLPIFSGPTPGVQNKISGDPNNMDYKAYKEWRKQNN